MRRFVENDINALLLKRVAEFTRYIVYAALPLMLCEPSEGT